ncbi:MULTISPECIES: carboxymuconolactone decarboxylase family protein [Thermomonospora]|uniref:Alkylhydroperoxidase like protein, AhpD family n=1 Tax=Thermomonospora curvata (strain ATCC 19995 / DSM 43183 / JCM 3096 / KCTC 9072 / NBRC 15933 / NCIMB 10081 / Henssen B9) TaxID=471852 RepID=D1A9R3_THECD|nr:MULTISPECIES: carboxymuconolactone decarboxylase family protein [Thermomonospora]ACY98749.1 alkylhydroperoxidase like protein, AhpD family [Thermomonospora curvata DSM 43183]PKK13379.1 MAG: carboxymuconolactone decarboxylase family protein [Thermomonospora sp. CIF 1]
MEARMDLAKTAPKPYQAVLAAYRTLAEGPLDPVVQELVKIRASQLNGCAFCLDLHVHEARRRGESEQRLALVAAWREAPVFSEAERAALAYTEEATRLSERGVSEEVWQAVTACFDQEEAGALVVLVALINALNRLGAPLRRRPAVR